jgi:V8-like Glu-specific endopeptidase
MYAHVHRNDPARDQKEDVAYTTDTKPGSSGSPVFTDSWQVYALHKSSRKRPNRKGGKKTIELSNVGTLISAILAALATTTLTQPMKIIANTVLGVAPSSSAAAP